MKWSQTYDAREVFGTRNEQKNLVGGPGASVTLECDYAIRHELADDLMKNSRWPFTPAGKVAPRPQTIAIKPKLTDYTTDTDEEMILYKEAELEISYGFDDSAGEQESPGGGGGSGRQYYTESFEPQMEIISLTERQYHWLEGTAPFQVRKPIDEKNLPHFRKFKFSIRRTFYNWLYVPTTFLTLLGKSNDALVTFPSLGLTFDPEHLVFFPQNAQRSISSEGTNGYTITVLFQFQEGGWNKLPVGPKGEMKEIYYNEAGDPPIINEQVIPHPPADFSEWIF